MIKDGLSFEDVVARAWSLAATISAYEQIRSGIGYWSLRLSLLCVQLLDTFGAPLIANKHHRPHSWGRPFGAIR